MPLALWRLSVCLQPLFPASGAPWSFAMPPFLERSRVTTTTGYDLCSQWITLTSSLIFANLITFFKTSKPVQTKFDLTIGSRVRLNKDVGRQLPIRYVYIRSFPPLLYSQTSLQNAE